MCRRLAAAHRIDLLIRRKPAGLLLRESEPAIDGNLEHAPYPGHQLDIGAILLDEPVPRTEGTRFIVSRLAPLDADLHCQSFRFAMCGAVYHADLAASTNTLFARSAACVKR